ncbi:hypothetical protein [Pseudobacteroides cellulosolvens]|uniref:Uncharacterized protein n=1 Tax=Pseudobacteroides cellulosolvens ATCC 35603 = DSM 2933 TaxID=398512 RepID=A0A0L6JRW7_9FIRM|nr:hypothetical protein [Pseudobacteroides cellulosolvens]KNY28533.1 hypothetical protein Bccel_3807 [Pseudobacteroides cellulosolvens ATCC 35603 = DSM 2933]
MKIFVITPNKRILIFTALLMIFSTSVILTGKGIHNKIIVTFNNSLNENLINSFMPKEQKIIYEDNNRLVYKNGHFIPPSPLPTSSLSKAINHGIDIKFRILLDEPFYLRPLYDPSWKSTHYRGWLDLPIKNMEARHRIFAFSPGGSMNYDIIGSLGFSTDSPPSAPLDNHHNINFLIYGFNVKSVRSFENQVTLIGQPKHTGVQIVSIVQNDLLPEGVCSKDFLFQLSTPEGYEIDFYRNNVIRYEHLLEIIKENTVGAFDPLENKNKSSKKILNENTDLQKELSYYIPLKDEIIYQQSCKNILSLETEAKHIKSMIMQGKKIPFNYNYKKPQYKRPLYHPSWKTNYKRKWSYIPTQIEYNLHRLLIIPQSRQNQKDFFGTLGFNEKFLSIKPEEYGFIIYNFNISDIKLYKNQLFLIGIPSRTGAQIVSINSNNLKGYKKYKVILVTPDNSEVDCNILIPFYDIVK